MIYDPLIIFQDKGKSKYSGYFSSSRQTLLSEVKHGWNI